MKYLGKHQIWITIMKKLYFKANKWNASVMIIWPCGSAQSLFRLRSLCSMSTGGVDLADDAKSLK